MEINKNNSEVLKLIQKSLDDKLGVDIKILDIRETSSLGDFFVIASGKNHSQIRAMADEVEGILVKNNIPIRSREGTESSGWILLDFYNYIVHIFTEETRETYTFDKAWKNSPEVAIEL